MDSQRLPLPKHRRIKVRLCLQLFLIDEKIQRPGDIEAFLRLDLPNPLGTFCAAVVAEIDAEGGDDVVIHRGDNIFDKVIVSALLVLQHFLRLLEQSGLEPAVGKFQPQIDQVACGPFRRLLYALQCPADRRFHQNSIHIFLHAVQHLPVKLYIHRYSPMPIGYSIIRPKEMDKTGQVSKKVTLSRFVANYPTWLFYRNI